MSTRHLWWAQLILLAGAVLWAMFDAHFEPLIQYVLASHQRPLVTNLDWLWRLFGSTRLAALVVLGTTVPGILLGLVLHSFHPKSGAVSRSIASNLGLMTVIASWCGLLIHHTELHWYGKGWQLASHRNQLDALVAVLQEKWPTEDGDLPTLGPFMAYPIGKPSVLIFLQAPLISDDFAVSAVERSTEGALRLQLSGSNHDDWVEWHPPPSKPNSFVGGLQETHILQQSIGLGEHWHLARYGSSQGAATESVEKSPAIVAIRRSGSKY